MASTQSKTVHTTWASQKDFPHQLACVHHPHGLVLPLQATLQFLNNLLVLFVLTISLLKVDSAQTMVFKVSFLSAT